MTGAVAIILAGGRGTRLGALTSDTPKPLLPIAGRPFVEWALASLATSGISRVVVAAGYRAEAIEAHFRVRRTDGLAVTVEVESTPLGTGGAIAFAAEAVPAGDPLLVANGDSCIAGDLATIWSHLDGVEGVIIAGRLADAGRSGLLEVSPTGLLRAMREKEGGSGLVNAGTYLLRRRLLEHFPARRPLSFEREVLPQLLAKRVPIRVVDLQAPFIDIGVRESLADAETFVNAYLRLRSSRDHQ